MPSPGLISRAPFTAPDLAFLRHLLGSDEGVKQLVFILVRSRFSLRFFSQHVAFCTLYLVAALHDRAVNSTEVDFGARTLPVTRLTAHLPKAGELLREVALDFSTRRH